MNYEIRPISEVGDGAILMGEVQYLGDSFKCAYYTKKIIRENNDYRIVCKDTTMVLDKDDHVIVRAF
jgi:hypothetical protein